MAVLDVVYFPDAPLTQKAAPVTVFDKKLEELVQSMFETMHAYQGVGLAAPQVGLSKRVFVLQEPEGLEMCFVNPEIAELDGREEGEEGCLSMPGIYAMVPRATQLKIRAQDVQGEAFELDATNFLARIIQHENDHLDGVLFPERLDLITRQLALEEWAKVREELLSERRLG